MTNDLGKYEYWEKQPFYATKEFVSNFFNDFIKFYDSFKRGGCIGSLTSAKDSMILLAEIFKYKGNYKVMKSVNRKAADYLMEFYKNKIANNNTAIFFITVDDLQKYRECLE